MPSFLYPYNYCDGGDEAATWATVTEYRMRTRRFHRRSLAAATAYATVAFRRLAIAIGGTQ